MIYLEENPKIKAYLNVSTATYEQIKTNTLAVRVFFNDLSYTFLTQAPKGNSIDLLAKVGGLLGTVK